MKTRIILADPPWEFNNRYETRKDNPRKKSRFGIGVAQRYSHGVMSARDLKALPVADIAADDAYLFMWTTWTHMQEALDVIDSWDFDYITCAFVWVKTNPIKGGPFMGPGRYTFSNTEPCLLARRKRSGKLWHPNTGWKPSQVVTEPHPRDEDSKIIHSRKPACIHEHLERWLVPHAGQPPVELFATQERNGWITLGGAIDGRDIRESLASLRDHSTD